MIPSIPPYRRIEAHLIHGVHERIQVVSGGDDGLKVLPPGGPWLLFDGVETAELPLGMENQRGTQ